MSKKKIIILIGLAIILVAGLTFAYMYIESKKDSVKFKKEYESYNNVTWKDGTVSGKYLELDINRKNPIVYLNDDTIIDAMKSESKIIYFGFPDCNWCRNMAPVLIKAAEDNGIEKLYYYPFRDLRNRYEKGDKKAEQVYDEIVKMMDKHVTTTFDEGKKKGQKKITAPTVVVTNKGKVISYHKNTVDSHTNYSKKLTEKQKNELYKIYEDMILELIMCTDDC